MKAAALGTIVTLAACFAPAAFAQQPTGTIAGRVIDQSGGIVAAAAVTIVHVETQSAVRVATSAAGVFSATSLAPGAYELSAEAPGFKRAILSLQVEVGRASPATIKLELGSLSETVNVQSNEIRVNPAQVALEGIVTSRLIGSLPFNGRNFFDAGQFEPGVQATRDDILARGGFARLSFSGQTGLTTRVAIDGVDSIDEFTGSVMFNISQDAIREFQVSRAMFDVSTGLTGSGAVNIATKSGGNDWRSSAVLFWRGGEVSAAGGQAPTPFDRTQGGASAGGRLVRNRLFAFAGYESNNQNGTVTTTMDPFTQFSGVWPAPFDERLATGRLDWNVTPSMRAFSRVTWNWNEGIPSVSLSAARMVPVRTSVRAVQLVGGVDTTRNPFMHSLRVGYTRNRLATDVVWDLIPVLPGTGGRPLTVGQAGATLMIGPNPNSPILTEQATLEVRYDGSLSRGTHLLRWGADVNRIRISWLPMAYAYGPQVNITINDNRSQFGDNILLYPVRNIFVGNGLACYTEVPMFGHSCGGIANDRVHLYMGDTWRVSPRVTMTAGLRWVFEPGPANPGLLRPAILDTFQPGLSTPDRRDWNNFAPQLGVTWTPSEGSRWVVRAGAGVFYDLNRLQNVTFSERNKLIKGGISADSQQTRIVNPVTGEILFDLANWPTNVPLGTPGFLDALYDAMGRFRAATLESAANYATNPTDCEQSRTCTFLAPDYPTPSSRQFVVGVQRELRPGLVLSADYVRNQSVNFMMRHNLNRNGAADTLDVARAIEAMRKVHESLGCDPGPAGVDCAIKKKVSMGTYAGQGLGSTATASPSGPTNAAFPGMNPNFNAMWQLEMDGFSTYDALQFNVRGSLPNLGRIFTQPFVVASYALGRLEGTAEDQAVLNVSDRTNNDDGTAFRGPTSLDRRHVFSLAALATLPGRVHLNTVWKAYSALPQTLYLPQASSLGAEIFYTDLNGDGINQEVLPGTNRGSYGRDLGCGTAAMTRAIGMYNASHAGQLTPAGRALVDEGLFTEAQLRSLGAVTPRLQLPPEGQVCLDPFFTTDLRISRTFTRRQSRVVIEPLLEVFNVFNIQNYDLPGNKLSGSLNNATGSLNGTTTANRTNRADATGSFTPGAPRSWQVGLRVSF